MLAWRGGSGTGVPVRLFPTNTPEPSGSCGAQVCRGERLAGGYAGREDSAHMAFEAVALAVGQRLRERLLEGGASGLGAIFFSTSQSVVGSDSGTSTSAR